MCFPLDTGSIQPVLLTLRQYLWLLSFYQVLPWPSGMVRTREKGFTGSHFSRSHPISVLPGLAKLWKVSDLHPLASLQSRFIHCTAPQGSHQLFTSLMEQQCPQSPNPISVFIFHDLSLKHSTAGSNSLLHFLFPWSSYQAFQTFLQLLLVPLAPPLGPGCGNPGSSGLCALYLCTCLASSSSIRMNPRVPREPRQSLARMWRKSCQTD